MKTVRKQSKVEEIVGLSKTKKKEIHKMQTQIKKYRK